MPKFGGSSRKTVLTTALIAALTLGAGATAVATIGMQSGSSETYTPPAAAPPVTRSAVKVYIIGDSVTGGSAGSGHENERYGNVMASGLNWALTTDAVGATGFAAKGPQSSKVDASFETRVDKIIAAKPDVVIVAGGRNDAYTPVEEVAPKVAKFFTQLRTGLPSAKIVTIAGWRWNTTIEKKAIAPQAALARVLGAETSRVNGTFIDPVASLPMFDDSNAGQYVSEDNFHPNREGYRMLGESLAKLMVTNGFSRGPEVWKEADLMSGEYVDVTDAFFE